MPLPARRAFGNCSLRCSTSCIPAVVRPTTSRLAEPANITLQEYRMLTLAHFLSLGAILFCLSVAGIFLNRKNVIILLMCIELMLLAVNMNFVAFSRFLGSMDGQVFVFFILTVAAAEAAIGLAILVVLFRNRGTINVAELDELKG
jgi:NADH-quinone oxidoreductase subunit K